MNNERELVEESLGSKLPDRGLRKATPATPWGLTDIYDRRTGPRETLIKVEPPGSKALNIPVSVSTPVEKVTNVAG